MNDIEVRSYLRKNEALEGQRRSHGLTETQLYCLLYLGSHGHNSSSEGVMKSEVRENIGRTRDLTRASRRLEDEGYVIEVFFERDNAGDHAAADRRVKRIKLSDKGKELYDHIRIGT